MSELQKERGKFRSQSLRPRLDLWGRTFNSKTRISSIDSKRGKNEGRIKSSKEESSASGYFNQKLGICRVLKLVLGALHVTRLSGLLRIRVSEYEPNSNIISLVAKHLPTARSFRLNSLWPHLECLHVVMNKESFRVTCRQFLISMKP